MEVDTRMPGGTNRETPVICQMWQMVRLLEVLEASRELVGDRGDEDKWKRLERAVSDVEMDIATNGKGSVETG